MCHMALCQTGSSHLEMETCETHAGAKKTFPAPVVFLTSYQQGWFQTVVLENSSSFRNTHIATNPTPLRAHILLLDVNVNSVKPKFSSPLSSKVLAAELKLLWDVDLSDCYQRAT